MDIFYAENGEKKPEKRLARHEKITIMRASSTGGCLAQLVEHRPYKARVIGSSPIVPTKRGVVVQLVRIPACHAGGRGFESRPFRHLTNILKN